MKTLICVCCSRKNRYAAQIVCNECFDHHEHKLVELCRMPNGDTVAKRKLCACPFEFRPTPKGKRKNKKLSNLQEVIADQVYKLTGSGSTTGL